MGIRLGIGGLKIGQGSTGINWSSYWNTLKDDGNTIAWFDRTKADGVVKDVNGVESIYWDLMYGSQQRGEEQDTGNIILFAVYEITATQANFFYTGCQVGDVFPCGTVKTCNASNKVKRVLGNHLCQPDATKRPINGVFDGSNDYMKTAPIVSFTDPYIEYLCVKQKSWVDSAYIKDGRGSQSSLIFQKSSSCKIDAYSGGDLGVLMDSPLNETCIIRLTSNGASSKLQVNAITAGTGILGAVDAGGITIGSVAGGNYGWSNIEYFGSIHRIGVEESADENGVYNYMKGNFNVSPAWFEPPVAIFTFDDGRLTHYTKVLPLLISKGITATFFITSDYVGNDVYGVPGCSWEQLAEIASYGNEMGSHAKTHLMLPTLNEAQIRAELDAVEAAFIANELPVPETFAYPGDEYNETVIAVCADYYNLAREVGGNGGASYFSRKMLLGSTDISLNSALTTAQIKALIDTKKANHHAIIFLCHAVDDTKLAQISELIDYIKAQGMQIIKFKDLNALMP